MDILTNKTNNMITYNLSTNYNEYNDFIWNHILNSISYIPTLNIELFHDSNNLNIRNKENKENKENKKNKIICSINKCTFKDYKETFCRLHYNKSYNLLCSIKDCNNLKRKHDLCYKHIKPLCCIMRCKCYAIAKELLCKKHKRFKIELYKNNI